MSSEDHARASSSHMQTLPTLSEPQRRQATDLDAEAYGIPPGYRMEFWDPDESPFVLLGAVFDADSLGRWIYDRTVARHGTARIPIPEVAGELWTLLIRLAGHVKRTEEWCPGRVRNVGDRDMMMRDYVGSGHRKLANLQELLEACERPMLKSAGTGGMPERDSDFEFQFVDTIFGHDRLMDRTEELMQSFRQ